MIDRIQNLVNELNKYRDAYYNHNESLISDKQYDELFDELQQLEQVSGVIFANSPTHTVGYDVQDKLNKVKHDHPMLSLNKTKEVKDVIKFAKSKPIIAMLKMDGLTCSLHYDKNGNLVKAETRGNGEIGEDILANAKQLKNIPLHINNHGIPFTVDGEVIVDYTTFNKLNVNGDYSHPRNLASGSIRQLDTKITADRNLKFIAWKVIEGVELKSFSKTLESAKYLGFEVVPYTIITTVRENSLNISIEELKSIAKSHEYPIDGLVFSYEDIEYGNSLGMTAHHPAHSFAFKFYDDCYETILHDIEWNTTRTGIVAPVAIFDPVDLDGAITTRATLHNISIMKELELGIGDTITVYRANAVIPKIDDNITRSNSYEFPTVCPCCGKPLELRKDGIAEILYCVNNDCPAKIINQFEHFASKAGMNIEGLSEATLEKFIDHGFINCYKDLYHLDSHEEEILKLEGFGKRSYEKLLKAVEASREVKLENFIYAFGIDQLGKSASKTIANTFNTLNAFLTAVRNHYDFTQLTDFGPAANKAIYDFFTEENISMVEELASEMKFIETEKLNNTNDFIAGKIFVVTGKFERMSRSEIEQIITEHGGKLSGSVSTKTSFLLTNDTGSGSSKNKKAMELGIPTMSEEEFFAQLQL